VGWDAHPMGGEEEHVGCWFTMGDIGRGDDRFKEVEQAGLFQEQADEGFGASGGYGQRSMAMMEAGVICDCRDRYDL
jgi:hypothetical protein